MLTKHEEWTKQAQQAIDRDDVLIYDVATGIGQIVDNVKHMRWFVLAVARELAGAEWFEPAPVWEE